MSDDTVVDERGVALSSPSASGVDVFFDDRHVWSFVPRRRGRAADGGLLVPWPQPMRPHLQGTVRVALRESGTDRLLFDDECRLGPGDGRVEFADHNGLPLMVDKWNFIQRPFSGRDPRVLQQMMEVTQEILSVLQDQCGLDAWVAFGSLLGAARTGRLIGHDSDVDIAYLSAHESPTDVALGMFQVGRALREHGLRVGSRAGSFVTVFFDGVDGANGSIDVYACFYHEGMLYEHATVRAPISRSAVVPTGTIELEGHSVSAPADVATMLEASYGPGWRTPDPSFQYHTPPAVKKRFWGWFGNYMRHRRPWLSFYASGDADEFAEVPTPFAEWVLPQLADGTHVVDVGAGNGRDTLYLAAQGHRATGLDVAGNAFGPARKRARRHELEARFLPVNLYDQRDVFSRGALLTRQLPKPRAVYARFLLHALDFEGEENFWSLAELLLRRGDCLFVEFRTTADRSGPHEFSGRFRRFLDPDDVASSIEAHGGEVIRRETGRGLAPFGTEDPAVCRMAARW